MKDQKMFRNIQNEKIEVQSAFFRLVYTLTTLKKSHNKNNTNNNDNNNKNSHNDNYN